MAAMEKMQMLKTKQSALSCEMLKNSKNCADKEEGRICIVTLDKIKMDLENKTGFFLFRYRNIIAGKIENQPLNEVLATFNKWREDTTYCARGFKSGTLEF